MKLSLAWIFNHIEARWEEQDIDLIVKKFNAIVAEIDHVSRFKIDLHSFYMARKEQESAQGITVTIPELSQKTTLPARSHTHDIINPSIINPIFMIKKDGKNFSWATLNDFGVEKDGLLPAFDVEEHALQGGWRSAIEAEDIILDVDNKSLTHRPDMWGHRGFAREIAAFLDLPFLHEDEFLKKRPVLYAPSMSPLTATTPISVENKAPGKCHRFAGLYIKSIENKPSNVSIAGHLLRIGLRPINTLVDLSNYIAFDWSQPVHVYDANRVEGKSVLVRTAQQGEKLELLDGQSIELSSTDLVIADAKKPMCLAGVKGGLHASVGTETKDIFFEAANFDAATVRRSALHHKLRTDSSARFEKTLDPNQAVDAIYRFLKLLETCSIKATVADEIVAVGIPPVKEQIIEVSHNFLEKRIGLILKESDVTKALTKRGFKVLESHVKDSDKERVYLISVPTYRGSKDVKIKEDILEEVARCYGFEKIPHQLPHIVRTPYDTQAMMRTRKIKHFLAHSAHMLEFQNYAFFDEENLASLGLHDEEALPLLNPVSENYSRLITSLIPGLMKNIKENQLYKESLAAFEWGKVWPYKKRKAQEQFALAGIFFERRNAVDFYACKAKIEGLFRFLDIEKENIAWQKVKQAPAPWYVVNQTAQVVLDNQIIGYAGTMEQSFLSKIDALPESNAFVFELNGELLRSLANTQKYYEPISRYQDSSFDISVLAPLTLTVAQLHEQLVNVSTLIKKVDLLDFFEKKEWTNQRSLTFRLWLSHPEKTLEKQDIDIVWQGVVRAAAEAGAQLRTAE